MGFGCILVLIGFIILAVCPPAAIIAFLALFVGWRIILAFLSK